MQKEIDTTKGIKSALKYPIIALIATVVVVGVLVGFVLPAFGKLYASIGTELPSLTKGLLDFSYGVQHNGILILTVILAIVGGIFIYVRTPKGRYQLDKLLLNMPLLGRINRLKELSRCCRSIALLFRAGLPLTEIMPLLIDSTTNKAMIEALSEVQQDMLKGEGLSKPMAKNKLFLPTMVEMVKIGEESGKLDTTVLAVAESYETEAKDKTDSVIGLIQPAMTIIIGGVIGIIAMSMVTAMYSVYGQTF